MKYTLYLTDKDPKYGIQIIECHTGQEARECKKKAIEQGYKVKVKGERHEQNQSSIEK